MKMNLEFSSTEELLFFIHTMGHNKEINVLKAEALEPLIYSDPIRSAAIKAAAETRAIKDKQVVQTVEDPGPQPAEVVKIPDKVVKADVEKEVKPITKEMIREVFGKLMEDGKGEEIRALTLEYGAKNLSGIKQEDYMSIYCAAELL